MSPVPQPGTPSKEKNKGEKLEGQGHRADEGPKGTHFPRYICVLVYPVGSSVFASDCIDELIFVVTWT